jgi:hypothetical protein
VHAGLPRLWSYAHARKRFLLGVGSMEMTPLLAARRTGPRRIVVSGVMPVQQDQARYEAAFGLPYDPFASLLMRAKIEARLVRR